MCNICSVTSCISLNKPRQMATDYTDNKYSGGSADYFCYLIISHLRLKCYLCIIIVHNKIEKLSTQFTCVCYVLPQILPLSHYLSSQKNNH